MQKREGGEGKEKKRKLEGEGVKEASSLERWSSSRKVRGEKDLKGGNS